MTFVLKLQSMHGGASEHDSSFQKRLEFDTSVRSTLASQTQE
jgi:hypothetical protein